jgi:hypothetical protein
MECSVCCTQTRADKFLTCTSCEVKYCKTCQLTQNTNTNTFACLQCRTPFTRVAAQTLRMYPEWKRIEELRLLENEKRKLPETQPLVEWEREYRRQHARLRFGERMTIPERPQLQESTDVFLACPRESCRGFIAEHSDTCETCSQKVCKMCHEINSDGHVCKAEVLQTIALLKRDSKSCPKCAATIFRTQGCDHMHCTWCNTHFNWETGLVLKVSSNGHYRDAIDIERAHTVAQRVSASAGAGGEDCMDMGEVRTALRRLPDSLVKRTLYSDFSVVQYAMEKYYGTNVIGTKRDNTLMNLRVMYLMNEITEAQWRSRVFAANKSFDLARAVAFQFGLYVEYVQHFQRLYVQEESAWDPGALCGIISDINGSLALLAEEYGSERIAIRLPTDSDDVPGLLR